MYQLHIFSEKELVFSAYMNVRDFVRSTYKSIMTNIGGISNLDVSRMFQSHIVECFIDDKRYEHFSVFRRFPKLANTVLKISYILHHRKAPSIQIYKSFYQPYLL